MLVDVPHAYALQQTVAGAAAIPPPRRLLSFRTAAPHRLAFIDIARACAILLMIQGHTLDALLASAYRTTSGFFVWTFVRGLTSCLFLFLSGFVFTMSTHRDWRLYAAGSRPAARRVGRYVSFIALGYLLHFPAARLLDLRFATSDAWRSFMAVDILQCIGVSLLALQGLVLVTRERRAFAVAAAALGVAAVGLTPLAWNAELPRWLPQSIAAFVSPRAGSLFPVLPWAGYMFLGAVAADCYLRCRHDINVMANRVLLPAGVIMLLTGLACARSPLSPFGQTEFWLTSPNQFLIRAGLVLVLLGAIARATANLSRVPAVVSALSREALLIYVVHVCLIYGSRWNTGLRQRYGGTLELPDALTHVALLWLAMGLLALGWSHMKSIDGRIATFARTAGVGALVASLL